MSEKLTQRTELSTAPDALDFFHVVDASDTTDSPEGTSKKILYSNLVPDASTTVEGKVELATDAETITGTDTGRAMTPSNLTAKIDTDGTLAGNLDTRIPSQKAVKTYVDTELSTGWIDGGEVPTYSSVDTATGVITVSTGAKTKYPLGSKIKFDQSQALTSYWSFDTNSNDGVGSNNGTDTAITYSAGKFSNAAVFNGTTSKIVITDASSLKPTGEFTIGMWVKSNTTGTRKELFASYSANTNIAGIDLFIDTSNSVAFVTGSNTGTTADQHWTGIIGRTNVCDNNWHYVVVSYRNNFCQLYIDGNFEAGEYMLTPAYAATNYVRIGCNNATGTDLNFMNGSIDDVFLINGYALDEQTIKEKYDLQTAQGTGSITITKFGVIQYLTDTKITFFTGTDYTLANSALSNFYYSLIKSPLEFPNKRQKWSLEVWNATLATQATPVTNTWYNLGSLQIVVPIGAWRAGYYAVIQANDATAGSYVLQCTLSTANNTESDNDFTQGCAIYVGAASGGSSSVHKEKFISLTAKTSFYLNTRTVTAGTDNIYNRGDQGRTSIRVICDYI